MDQSGISTAAVSFYRFCSRIVITLLIGETFVDMYLWKKQLAVYRMQCHCCRSVWQGQKEVAG